MKIILLITLLIINSIAESEFYTKEILFKQITAPTLVKVKIDGELYEKMVSNNIRIHSSDGSIKDHYIEHYRPNLLSSDSMDDLYETKKISLFSKNIRDGYTDYIFKPNGTPADKIILNTDKKEYKRDMKIYVANKEDDWHLLKEERVKKSKYSEIKNIGVSLNSSTNFIRLRVPNNSKNPLMIKSIEIKTIPNHLYFMAEPNRQYNIRFSDKNSKNRDNNIANLVYSHTPFIIGRLASLQKSRIVDGEIRSESVDKGEKTLLVVIVVAMAVLLYITIGLIKGKG
jgi:hypothetical protein